jgi:hypothetical protein
MPYVKQQLLLHAQLQGLQKPAVMDTVPLPILFPAYATT